LGRRYKKDITKVGSKPEQRQQKGAIGKKYGETAINQRATRAKISNLKR